MNLTKQTHNAPEPWDLTDGFCYELIVLNGIWLLFQISNYPLKGIILTLKFSFIVFNTDSKIILQGV